MAILILQEQGHLSVNDPLATYLPNLPKAWESITIHQLLTHTSGIMHSWALPGFRNLIMIPATLEETIARFKEKPLVFAPGEGFQYSGVGYFLLAAVIAKVSGQPYATFVRQAIFEPLGMHNTGADQPSLMLPQRASGYMRKGDTLESVASMLHADIYMPIFTGGGNLYSTVEDLSRWDHALVTGKLISLASYRLMYTPVKQNYAYGWVVQTRSRRQEISHEGGGPGFNTYILRVPEQKVCVIVCSNVLPMPVQRIASNLAAIVFGEPLRTE
jgi:CubicO group peptidase (beta-lactamase class C family)